MQSHKKETVIVDAAFLKTLASTVEQLVKDVRVLKAQQIIKEPHAPTKGMFVDHHPPTGSLYVDAKFHEEVSPRENKARAEQLNAELESLFAEYDIHEVKIRYSN